MNLEDLHKIIYHQRAAAIQQFHHDDGLMLFVAYKTFGDLRDQLRRSYLFDPAGSPHYFMFMNVKVSWSPAVEQPAAYAYGRETLT